MFNRLKNKFGLSTKILAMFGVVIAMFYAGTCLAAASTDGPSIEDIHTTVSGSLNSAAGIITGGLGVLGMCLLGVAVFQFRNIAKTSEMQQSRPGHILTALLTGATGASLLMFAPVSKTITSSLLGSSYTDYEKTNGENFGKLIDSSDSK